MKKFLIIFFVILAEVCAGQPSITWQRTYNGPQNFNDYSYGIAESTAGTYFILGQSGSGLYLLKINDYGDTLWTRTSSRAATAITSSGDGGCVLAGSGYVAKYDKNGNIEWWRENMATGNYPLDIKKTSDGGYVCCSYYGAFDSQVFKIDSVGYLQWHKEFSSTRHLNFRSILEAYNSGYLVGGTDAPPFGDTSKAILYRLNLYGDTLWKKGYKIFNRHSNGLILQYGNGNYLGSGSTFDTLSTSSDKSRPYFLKLDTMGNIIYTKLFSHNGNYCDEVQDFNNTSQDKFIFSTIKLNGNFCNNGTEAKIFNCDSLGNILNSNIFTTTSDIELKKILPLFNGDIIFPGVLQTNFTNQEDIYVVRTDSNLQVKSMSISKNNANAFNTFRLYQNYPNPFNPSTIIKFSVLKKSIVTLTIHDITGKQISTLLSEKNYDNGFYEISWNGIDFPSGIYFCVMKSEGFQQSKKLLLIK